MELTTKKRKALSKSKFALPEQRKYPINDRAHAANAKARAEQQYRAGKISKSVRDRIDTKADQVLKKTK